MEVDGDDAEEIAAESPKVTPDPQAPRRSRRSQAKPMLLQSLSPSPSPEDDVETYSLPKAAKESSQPQVEEDAHDGLDQLERRLLSREQQANLSKAKVNLPVSGTVLAG
jgi:hypothetical protein